MRCSVACHPNAHNLFASDPEYGKVVSQVADTIRMEHGRLINLLRRFLYSYERYGRPPSKQDEQIPIDNCPPVSPLQKIRVHFSAGATYYAPSDPSGIGGMRREYIRATPAWHRERLPRFDCVFVKHDWDGDDAEGLLAVARIVFFFSFKFRRVEYQCALVHWYDFAEDTKHKITGMYTIRAGNLDGRPSLSIIMLDSISRAAHLIPDYGPEFVPVSLGPSDTLDHFDTFFVNKFIDYTAFDFLD